MFADLRTGPDGKLLTQMNPDYAAFKGAFGGWTAALALVAASSTAASDSMQPLALSVDYLGPIGPGQVEAQPEVLHATRHVRFVRVLTTQLSVPCASSSVVLSTRRPTARIDAAAMPQCTPAQQLPSDALDGGPNTWLQRFERRTALGNLLQPNDHLRSLTWTRLCDSSPGVHATVAALADASLPRIYFHFDRITPIATVTMSVHFHADTAELGNALTDFVLVEASGTAARHGTFDQTVRVWSGGGLLLATSTQLVRYDVLAG